MATSSVPKIVNSAKGQRYKMRCAEFNPIVCITNQHSEGRMFFSVFVTSTAVFDQVTAEDKGCAAVQDKLNR